MHGSRDSSSTPTVALGPKGTGRDVTESPDLGIPRGSRIGRFIVLRTLGVGGMGVVLAAYDTELDRTVALKLLRPDIAPAEGATQARARLLREAQAMARLRHPNVVTVYEVGEFEEKVFLAMEYVPGPTLLEWGQDRRNEPRGWAKIVAAFVQAGRGLAAAHAHDMVHRDFKPSNVLVDRDRVLLTDFGIASITSRSPETGPTDPGTAPVDYATTRGGSAAIGTTPYMAPELFRDGSADARSDQFAFCVGLFELLYGRRPFEGHDRESWSRSITRGRVVETEPGDVPDWIRSAVMRGLQGDPNLRWPSIAKLVDALDSPDAAGLGRGARIAIAIVTAATFMLLPILAQATVFDRGSYPGVIAQTIGVIAVLAALGWLRRDVTFATPTNRRSFLGALTVLTLQLPLELVNAALGVDPVASDIQHLLHWAAMAALFAVIADRRFLALSASYLAFVPIALVVPEHVVMVLACSNAALVVFLAIIWRERAPPPRGLA